MWYNSVNEFLYCKGCYLRTVGKRSHHFSNEATNDGYSSSKRRPLKSAKVEQEIPLRIRNCERKVLRNVGEVSGVDAFGDVPALSEFWSNEIFALLV